MAVVVRTEPAVRQVLPAEVLGTPLWTSVDYYDKDAPVVFVLDAGTAAVVMRAIREHALESENKARRTYPNPDANGHYASTSHRLRTVEAAWDEAHFLVDGPAPTNDND